MRRRRIRWAVVVGFLAAVALIVGSELLAPASLQVGDAKKIPLDFNFNLEACERRLGKPPTRREWYSRGEDGTLPLYLVPLDSEGRPGFTNIPDEMAEWESSRAVIRVYFTRGRVVGVTAEEGVPFWLRLTRSLGL